MKRYLAISASVLALGGCTTSMVNSTPITDKTSATGLKANHPQLTYFLPESVLVATVKKKAPPTPDDPPAGTNATATVTTNITIDGKKAAEGRSEKDKDPTCDEEKATYQGFVTAHNAYMTEFDLSVVAIETALNGSLKTRLQQQKATATYLAAKTALAKDNGRVRDAEAQSTKVVAACEVKLMISLTNEVIADRDHPYALLMADDAWSSDKVSAKLDAKGMLTAISTTADDKTTEALTEAASAIGVIYGTLNPLGAGNFQQLSGLKTQVSPLAGVGGWKTFGFESEGIGDPEDAFRIALQKALKELVTKTPTPLPTIKLRSLPDHPFRFRMKDILDLKAGQGLGDTGYFLQAKCSPAPGDLKRSAQPPGSSDKSLNAASMGVMMSSPRTCELTVAKAEVGGTPDYVNGDKSWVSLLDSGSPMEVFLPRTRLINRPTSYAFKEGQLTELSYEKPSTVAAAVALPGKIIGGLFSGLVSGIQGPGGAYGAQAKYLDAQAAVYTSQAALIKAKSDADEAKKPKVAADAPTQ